MLVGKNDTRGLSCLWTTVYNFHTFLLENVCSFQQFSDLRYLVPFQRHVPSSPEVVRNWVQKMQFLAANSMGRAPKNLGHNFEN